MPRGFTLAEVRDFLCAQTEPRPDVIAFARALRITRRLPEECVFIFIDDRPENREPARALGIHGIRFESLAGLRRPLSEFGLDAGDK